MKHYELPIFRDDREHAEKLAIVPFPPGYEADLQAIRDDHERVRGNRVRDICGDLKRLGMEIDYAQHTPESINAVVIEAMRKMLRAARQNFQGTDDAFLVFMNDPTDEGRTPPRLSVLFAGIPYHPNAITLEDLAEAMK